MQDLNVADAAARCSGVTLGGVAARLPTVKELLSIVDDTAFNPASDPVFARMTDRVWTSTVASQTAQWSVDFINGATAQIEQTSLHAARCVATP